MSLKKSKTKSIRKTKGCKTFKTRKSRSSTGSMVKKSSSGRSKGSKRTVGSKTGVGRRSSSKKRKTHGSKVSSSSKISKTAGAGSSSAKQSLKGGRKTSSLKAKSKTKSLSKSSKTKAKSMRRLFDELCKDSQCKSMLKKHLTKELYEKLQYKTTRMGSGLMDVIQSGLINHDSDIGAYAPDPDAYHAFSELFNPIIEEYHGFKPADKQPAQDLGDPSKLADLDPSRKFIVSTRIRVGRSIKNLPFNPCMKECHYKELEQKVSQTLLKIPNEELKGQYLSLVEMSKETQKKMINDHFLFKEGDKFLQAANACRYWPVGRGIFINKAKTFMVWIGEEDHIRIISMEDGANLRSIYSRLMKAIKYIESYFDCVHDSRLGYLTFCPTNLGTTLRASVMIKLPKLAANKQAFEMKAEELKLQIRGAKGEHSDSPDGLYDVSNKRRLGLTEFQAVMEMQTGVLKLIELEKSMGGGTGTTVKSSGKAKSKPSSKGLSKESSKTAGNKKKSTGKSKTDLRTKSTSKA